MWGNSGIGSEVFPAMAPRPGMTESLILDSSHASRGTLGHWLYWGSRPRQSSLVQNCIHAEVWGKKKMPKRSRSGSVLQEYCSLLQAHISFAGCSHQFSNRGLNTQFCPWSSPNANTGSSKAWPCVSLRDATLEALLSTQDYKRHMSNRRDAFLCIAM